MEREESRNTCLPHPQVRAVPEWAGEDHLDPFRSARSGGQKEVFCVAASLGLVTSPLNIAHRWDPGYELNDTLLAVK